MTDTNMPHDRIRSFPPIPPDVPYAVALDWLVKKSGWHRHEVVADGESAGWFCAQRATSDEERELAQRMGVIVGRGK